MSCRDGDPLLEYERAVGRRGGSAAILGDGGFTRTLPQHYTRRWYLGNIRFEPDLSSGHAIQNITNRFDELDPRRSQRTKHKTIISSRMNVRTMNLNQAFL